MSPVDGASTGRNPVFHWDAVPGAVYYRVQVSTSATFGSSAYTVETINTYATPPTDLANVTYFWRVAAADGSKSYGPYSQTWTFTKSALAAPGGITPPAGTVLAYPDQSPVIQWLPVAGAKNYKVQVDDDSAFLSPIVNTSTPNTAYAITAALILNKPYYWRVWAVTLSGQESAKTDFGQSITITWPASAPALLSPADSATVSDVVLRWNPVVGATTYDLQVSPNGDFANNVSDSAVVFGNQYSPAATYANGGYYWRVRPKDTFGRAGDWSVTRQFTRASAPPAAPTNLLADTTQFSFSWDPVPNAGAYEVQIDADGNFNSGAKACTTFHARYTAYSRPLQGTAQPVYPANAPQPASNDCTPDPGTFYWRVRALDTKPEASTGVFGPFSATASATVAYPAAPAEPLAQLPTSSYTAPVDCSEAPSCTPQSDTPLLTWDPAPGARSYYVRIALDPQFSNEVERYFVVGTELQPRESLPDNSAGTSYYWWVQPCSDLVGAVCVPDDQASVENGAVSFQKLADPVEVVSPAADATVTDVVPFTWQSTYSTQPEATGVGAYRIQVAKDLAFTNLVTDDAVDQTSFQSVGSTYEDGSYFWRVQAVDGSELALSWSSPRTFVKKSGSPQGLRAGRLDDTSALPVLAWDSTPYVSGYLVQVYSGTNALFPANSLVKETTVLLPSYALDKALPAGTYSWRVAKLDPSGNRGPWQELDAEGNLPTFAVAPPKPVLSSPADGSSVAGNALLYTWSFVPAAAQYRIQTSTTSSFTTTIENQVTVLNAWAPSSATYPNGTIYWRVQALDGDNQVIATSSPTWSFFRDGSAPTATITVTGATTSLRPSIPVTFSEPVSGISASTVKLTRATGGAAVSASLTCADGSSAAVPCAGPGVVTAWVQPAANVVPGETYTVAVTSGITDGIGYPAVPTSKSFRALLVVQDNTTSPKFSSGWSSASTSAASGGTYKRTGTKGSYATWTFVGSSAKVGYLAQRAAGKAAVYVDGVLKATVDMYASSTTRKTYTVSLTKGQHTVKVVALGTRNAAATSTAINVDFFGTS